MGAVCVTTDLLGYAACFDLLSFPESGDKYGRYIWIVCV